MALDPEHEKMLQTSVLKALRKSKLKTMARHVNAEFKKGFTFIEVLDGLRDSVEILRDTAWEVNQTWNTAQALKKSED